MNLIEQAIENYVKFNDDNNILIYQMGKVGSSSLEASIENSLHLHTLYGNSPCWIGEKQRKPGIKGFTINSAKFFIRRFALKRRKKTVKIISVVRDPLARNVSMFFQELGYWITHYVNTNNPDMRYIDEKFLLEVFCESFDHEYFDRWFDKEIKILTGIDIFQTPFDTERGYSKYKNGKYELLLVTAETLNQNIDVIEGFICNKITLKHANDSKNKWYSSMYKEFKLMLPRVLDNENVIKATNSKTANYLGYNE